MKNFNYPEIALQGQWKLVLGLLVSEKQTLDNLSGIILYLGSYINICISKQRSFFFADLFVFVCFFVRGG